MKNLLHNLTITKKLCLISLSFLLPITVMFYFIITTYNKDINFAQMEILGNQYQKNLEPLLKYIPEHKILITNYINGDKSLNDKISKKQSEIDNAFQRLKETDKKIGKKLQFTEEALTKSKKEHILFSKLKGEWEKLKAETYGLTLKDSNDRHIQLISHIRDGITYAGDKSNLILDPDLDSYYLMDVTLLALPQTQDRLAVITAYTEELIKKENITENEKIDIHVYIAMLREADMNRIKADILI